MTQVSYHRDADILQGFAGEYSSPFDRPEWFALLADRAQKPIIAIAGGADGKAAMALRRQNGRLEPLINWYSFQWRPLGSSGHALTDLCLDLAGESRRITLWPLPNEDGSADRLEESLQAAGWTVFREQCDISHALAVGGRSYAEYSASLPGKLRTTLKRKRKKVEIEIFNIFKEDIWQSYEEIYAESWKPEEGDPVLLRAFALSEAEAGRMRLGVATHEGRAVAAQFWTVESGCAYIHKLAYREDAKGISPGTSLTAALLQHVIDIDRVEWVDFGTGDDPYKRDWMDTVRPRYRLDAFCPAEPRNWPHILRGKMRQLASRVASG